MVQMRETTIPSVLARELAERVPGLVSAYLFGSVAEGRAHRESDVDVGLLLAPDVYPRPRDRFEVRLRLSDRLRAALGREVDVVILNDTPPTLARRIMTAGERVVVLDREADHTFLRTTLSRAADLEPFLRRTRRVKLSALRR
jgi:predicted nucleotidyltransferase